MVCRSTVARAAAAVMAAALTVGGCGDGRGDSGTAGEGGASNGQQTSSAPVPDLSVVVLGDSIPYNSPEDCPGCTGFADSYGEALGEEFGQTVDVANLSRHDGARTRDIADQLGSGELTESLANADVVIVSVGFNDQPPYVDPDQPCHAEEPATDQELIDAVAATSLTCVDEVTATLRRSAGEALREIRAQAPRAAVAALVPYDSWNGWAAFDDVQVRRGRTVTRLIAYALDAWRSALCIEVLKVDGVCVDTYRSFNGPDGRRPAGDLLAPDYTHPSQQGNDLIRDVLLAARLLG